MISESAYNKLLQDYDELKTNHIKLSGLYIKSVEERAILETKLLNTKAQLLALQATFELK